MEKERDWTAVCDCEQKIAYYNARISDEERVVHELDEKIRRLKEVQNIVKTNKKEIGKEINNMEQGRDSISCDMWCGSNKQFFENKLTGVLVICSLFKNDVDSLQDALNDEITRQENEKYEHDGLIGQFRIVLNDWSNWLENLLN